MKIKNRIVGVFAGMLLSVGALIGMVATAGTAVADDAPSFVDRGVANPGLHGTVTEVEFRTFPKGATYRPSLAATLPELGCGGIGDSDAGANQIAHSKMIVC
jgi:hypothetical protein